MATNSKSDCRDASLTFDSCTDLAANSCDRPRGDWRAKFTQFFSKIFPKTVVVGLIIVLLSSSNYRRRHHSVLPSKLLHGHGFLTRSSTEDVCRTAHLSSIRTPDRALWSAGKPGRLDVDARIDTNLSELLADNYRGLPKHSQLQ